MQVLKICKIPGNFRRIFNNGLFPRILAVAFVRSIPGYKLQ